MEEFVTDIAKYLLGKLGSSAIKELYLHGDLKLNLQVLKRNC
jgi:hypothetical protein